MKKDKSKQIKTIHSIVSIVSYSFTILPMAMFALTPLKSSKPKSTR
jgi:hypothetical protein